MARRDQLIIRDESDLTTHGTVRKHQMHGMSKTPEFCAWGNMLSRCLNPNAINFDIYGGRGITVCREWATSFLNFYNDVGPRPSPNHSIDRIDNNKGYFPENVRWSTKMEQQQNLRKNVFITFNGQTHCLREWQRITGISHSTLRNRLAKGLPAGEVLKPTEKRDPSMKGVSFNKKLQKWQVYKRVNNRVTHIGYFLSLDDAKDAYRKAA